MTLDVLSDFESRVFQKAVLTGKSPAVELPS